MIFRKHRARKAREAAQRAYNAAVARNDTRSIHSARKALQGATLRCLKVRA